MSELERCPAGSTIYVHVALPVLDCAAPVLAGYPEVVRDALRHGSRLLRLPEYHEELASVLALPGVDVERYFRANGDPDRLCRWDRIGLSCRHDPACSE